MSIKERIKSIFRKADREKKVITGEEAKDKTYCSKRNFKTREEALVAFEESKRRLFDVNKWSTIPHSMNSKFQLFSPQGEFIDKPKPALNDCMKIVLPGPLPENWVRVVSINEKKDMVEFTVSPSEDPKAGNEEVKHFFEKKATSTFRVELKDLQLIACEIGKNESVNTNQTKSSIRPVVNTFIAEGGWAGFQKLQWKNLTDFVVGLI